MRTFLMLLLAAFLICVAAAVAFNGTHPETVQVAIAVGIVLVAAIFIGAILMMAADTAEPPVCECGQPIREGADMDLEDEFVWPPYGSRHDPP